MNTARYLKYVWSFFNIIHERIIMVISFRTYSNGSFIRPHASYYEKGMLFSDCMVTLYNFSISQAFWQCAYVFYKVLDVNSYPNQCLLIQTQWKHQNNLGNLLQRHPNDFNNVAVASLFISFNRFHTLLWWFFCWLWIRQCGQGCDIFSSSVTCSRMKY